jgi:hypothetical protein
VIALTSCKTIELGHAPVGCEPLPAVTLGDLLSDEQLNSMSDDVFDAVELRITALKERLRTQCEINKKHDGQYR